jgi:hypothetical protein
MKTIYIERLMHDPEAAAWTWTPEREQFDLESDFRVDEENLEFEMCRMAQILVRYGGVAAELEANLKRKEEYAKLVQARYGGALRSQYEAGGIKVTEGRLNDEVTQSPEYQGALAALHLLRSEAVEANHWYRSAMKKADMLNALAFRQNAELKRAYGNS